RHLNAAQQPRQRQYETLEERRTNPLCHRAERPAWVGISLFTAKFNRRRCNLRSRFCGGFMVCVCWLPYPLSLELFFHISKRRCGGHSSFIQLNLGVILKQTQQLYASQRIQLQV